MAQKFHFAILRIEVTRASRGLSAIAEPLYTSAKEDVIVVVCLSVCWQLSAKTSEWICMKFLRKAGNGPVNKRLNFNGDLIR